MNRLFDILNTIAAKLDTIADKLDRIALPTPQSDKTFNDFAQYYFDTFRKRKVTPKTMSNDMSRYNTHISPVFGQMPLSAITPEHVQNIVDGLSDRQKTAHEVFTLINVVMKAAIKHNLITHNPCDLVLLIDYEQQHGKALTKDEERKLLRMTDGTPYQIMFAVALYTGLRPNEYKTARIENGFVVARNSKQHDGKAHTKRIPISPMLAPYIPDSKMLPTAHKNSMTVHFKAILPTHKLYDMRTTFYSRCIECGVTDIARKLFMGHTLGRVANAYADPPDEWLLNEGNKLDY
ncbi:MAG: hypothetical protein K2O94_03415 [Clostridiales bacterium]|nr:hypothetical protein [Clostridiales bacterium]